MSLDLQTRRPDLSALLPRDAAVFLDFDGSLVDLAPEPDAINVTDALISLLAVLEDATAGACAIVTGRSVEDLRRHLPLIPHAVIGSHGAEGYLPGAPAYRHPIIGSDTIGRLHDAAMQAEDLPGVSVELKPTGVALHFRAAPDQGDGVESFAKSLLSDLDGFEILAAKAAIELRPADIGKDRAVANAMALPAFAGRTPVYVGDDTTDEPAIAWVLERGGIAIKVGEGESIAPYRVSDPDDLHATLAEWLESNWSDP